MVLSYGSEGNLRDHIHEKDLLHCDLHSGNILIQGGGCYITDLGLCGPVDDESSGKIYGIIPYIAPEILQGGKNTKQSDVYSIGMLMWEIFSGHPPFDDKAHGPGLILKICEGLRPQILPSIPDDYAQMMQKCWDVDPSKRPTIDVIWDFADNKLKEIYDGRIDFNNNINVSDGSSNSDSPQQAHENHPLAYHTSRILDDEI